MMTQLLMMTESEEKSPKKATRKTAAKTTAKASNTRSRAKRTTFRNAKLEREFVSFCQMLHAVPSAADASEPNSGNGDASSSLTQRIKKRLKSPIELISNPDFSTVDSEKILGEVLLGTGLEEVPEGPTKLPNLPVHLARLCETRLLTPEQERLLFQRMNYLRWRAQCEQSQLDPEKSSESDLIRIEGLLKASDWYRDWIVRSNMRLVISIIKKFVNLNNRFDDLLSEGTMALIRAIDKFDYDRGFRFSTYATQVVRRSSYRSVMLKQKERMRIEASTSEMDLTLPADSRASGIDENRWQSMRNRLSAYLQHLDRREKLIIRARFSLGGHRRVQTLQKLADVLGVSKERIRQLEKRALDKLRDLANEEQAEGPLL
jgi:RNA polymerase primary sigma factor